MSNKLAKFFRPALVLLGMSTALGAHPMGNFSVNHYSRLYFRDTRMELTYVLDLAEIPTFELLGQWRIDWRNQALLKVKSERQAKELLANLILAQAGQRVPLRFRSISPKTVEGAAGMPVLRISIAAEAPAPSGEVTYEDRNYPGRAGWKEIVVDHDSSAAIRDSSQGAKDISSGLTYYPADPNITPPQDITARVTWLPLTLRRAKSLPAEPDDSSEIGISGRTAVTIPPQAAPGATPASTSLDRSFSQQQPVAPGTIVRGDYLSRLLRNYELGWQMTLFGLVAAFGLGAMHAMSPGHGKTIVAAYLVGSRGTLRHAGLLGFVVTFTHTFTVFLLGLGVLFFQQYVIPEKIVPFLGVVSGLSIVIVGGLLLYRRAKALLDGRHVHHHAHDSHAHSHDGIGHHHAGHEHRHGHSHEHAYDQTDDHGHSHAHNDGSELVHSHGGRAHSHTVEGRVTLGSLIALGISGGLAPCPSALILMLSAIALGHPGIGLLLLIGFSSGLALVLMGIGMLALYARHLLPKSAGVAKRPLFRLIPVFSAVVVILLGLAMSAVSAGWVQPLRFLS